MYHELSMKEIKINDKGFTLIELLVVISVIAVLTTLLMANFIGIRQRARDAQRKSNLFNVQSALELYRADVGSYPLTVDCGGALSSGGTVYMSEVPCDPLDDTDYIYTSVDGTTYSFIACLENENDPERDGDIAYTASGCTTPASFTLTNP